MRSSTIRLPHRGVIASTFESAWLDEQRETIAAAARRINTTVIPTISVAVVVCASPASAQALPVHGEIWRGSFPDGVSAADFNHCRNCTNRESETVGTDVVACTSFLCHAANIHASRGKSITPKPVEGRFCF